MVVSVDVCKAGADGVTKKVVSAESVDVHVAAHADELRTRKVLQGEIIIKELGDANNVLRGRGLAGSADLKRHSFHHQRGPAANSVRRSGSDLAEEFLKF